MKNSEKVNVDEHTTQGRVARLNATIIRCWARRREINIELGHAFNELKRILGHGRWKRHFEETLAPQGISLRTAERYMKRAKKAEAQEESDNMSIFSPATDREAQHIRRATEKAQANVDANLNRRHSTGDILVYRLPLHMTADESRATDALRTSLEWPRAERQVVRLLGRLWQKCGVAGKGKGKPS